MSKEEWQERIKAPDPKPFIVRPDWENADAGPERFMNEWNPWQGLDPHNKVKRSRNGNE